MTVTADAGPRVKICGNTTTADIDAAAAAGADAIGVITSVPVDTPREVDRNRARELLAAVPPFVTGVLVTMADDAGTVIDLVEALDPDAVQVHGGLPPAELATLAAERHTIAAYDVAAADAITAAADVVDAILLDTVDDAGGGGTGQIHDWELARARVETVDAPVILAGGLDPDNVATAIETVGPYAVDVATGVATAEDPARKDPAAVRAFVATAAGGGGRA